MVYKTGESYYKEFTTADPVTGEAKNADSTPVATANKNGTDDSGFSLTVTNLDTGRYKITGTIPSGYAKKDVVNITISVLMNSLTYKALLETIKIDIDIKGLVVTDAGNTSQTFKTNLTESIDDYWKGTFVRFDSGSLLNQVKKVVAYNGTTKFITTDIAFTSTPSNNDLFVLINQ